MGARKPLYRSARLGAVLFWVLSVPAVAGPWEEASQGKSSFVSLGPDYSVQVPVHQVDGARLVLLNQGLADRLGLTAPDSAQLEKLILESFALNTGITGDTGRRMFATRYLDYNRSALQGLGNPQGDGRSLWTGERQIKMPDGRVFYADFTVKGSGRTPLARRQIVTRAGSNVQYSDGLQGMDEAVRGFIASNALARNGAEAVQDLAVIELPLKKVNPATGKQENAAITVRVGTQTREGHLEYFANDREKFRKLFEYTVKRDLGLPLESPVADRELGSYFRQLARNLGTESAVLLDGSSIHGSLTRGNQTTRGAAIDFGTFEAMDAFHGEHKYLYGQSTTKKQTASLSRYIDWIHEAATGAGYSLPVTVEELKREFMRTYIERVTDLRLQRLGLSEGQIAALPGGLKVDFYRSTEKLVHSAGKKEVSFYLGKIRPAAFDLRNVLRGSLRADQLGKGELGADWVKALLPAASWNTLSQDDLTRSPAALLRVFGKTDYRKQAGDYVASVSAIRRHLEVSGANVQEAVDRAAAIGAQPRPEAIFPDVTALMKAVRDPARSFAENSREAAGIVESLADLPGKNEISPPAVQELSEPGRNCQGFFGALMSRIFRLP